MNLMQDADIRIRYVILFLSFSLSVVNINNLYADVIIPQDEVNQKILLGAEEYKNNNYKEAWDIFIGLANAGNSNAQYWIGFMYEQGKAEGDKKILNSKKASEWYTLAADSGFTEASKRLELLFFINAKKEGFKSQDKITVELDIPPEEKPRNRRSSDYNKTKELTSHELGYIDGIEWADDMKQNAGFLVERHCVAGGAAAKLTDYYGEANDMTPQHSTSQKKPGGSNSRFIHVV